MEVASEGLEGPCHFGGHLYSLECNAGFEIGFKTTSLGRQVDIGQARGVTGDFLLAHKRWRNRVSAA